MDSKELLLADMIIFAHKKKEEENLIRANLRGIGRPGEYSAEGYSKGKIKTLTDDEFNALCKEKQGLFEYFIYQLIREGVAQYQRGVLDGQKQEFERLHEKYAYVDSIDDIRKGNVKYGWRLR